MNNVWLLILIINLIVPISMILFGTLFIKKPPKEINVFYGYRTHRSMKNGLTWEFAHQMIGKLWLIIGIILFIISLFISFLLFRSTDELIAYTGIATIFVQIVCMICPVCVTERALYKRFK